MPYEFPMTCQNGNAFHIRKIINGCRTSACNRFMQNKLNYVHRQQAVILISSAAFNILPNDLIGDSDIIICSIVRKHHKNELKQIISIYNAFNKQTKCLTQKAGVVFVRIQLMLFLNPFFFFFIFSVALFLWPNFSSKLKCR